MKTTGLFKAIAALIILVPFFFACNKNDDPSKNVAEVEIVKDFDDLAFFQHAFVDAGELDEYGDYSYVVFPTGEILDENDPTHLFISVEDMDEALRYWDSCLAPDIIRTTSADNRYTYDFTDAEGKSQGSVSFAPGTGGDVAVITPNLAGLEHISKVTFLLKSAWPFNDEAEPRNHVGDIRYFSVPEMGSQPFVCIRERSNGVKPYYVGITKETIDPTTGSYRDKVIETKWCPGEASAKSIYDMLHKDWDFYVAVFDDAGGGKLDLDQACWIDKNDFYVFVKYQYAINLINSGYERLDCVYHYPHRRILLKVNWLDEDALEYIIGEHSAGFSDENADNLFDGQKGTKWCSPSTNKTGTSAAFSGKSCWFVEFQTEEPADPSGYMLTTTDSAKKRSYRNPKEWALLGKKSIYDDWTVLDKRTNITLPAENSANCSFNLNQVPDGKDWQYFRLEITETKGGGSDYCMQLSGFKLTY